jgi:hypothetical protein
VRAANGERVEFKLSRNAAAQSLRYMLYSPMTAAQIPLQAHLAAAGDVSPLAETAFVFGGIMTDTSDGYFLSVTCSEDLPFFTDAEAAAAAKETFLGNFPRPRPTGRLRGLAAGRCGRRQPAAALERPVS